MRLLAERVQYLFHHAFEIAHHIVVPKSEDEITACLQISGSVRVRLNTIGMLPTIKFDHEPCIRAAEIHNESIERHLPTEFPSIKAPIAQAEPKESLCVRLLPTQSPRYCGVVGHTITRFRTPSPHPSP